MEVPPALTDESDQAEGSIFPPGATRQLLPEYFYAWIGLRLAQGTAGTGALQKHLATLAADLQRQARQALHRDVPRPRSPSTAPTSYAAGYSRRSGRRRSH